MKLCKKKCCSDSKLETKKTFKNTTDFALACVAQLRVIPCTESLLIQFAVKAHT